MSGAGKGLLLAVSAPSGAGKTSLVRALAERDTRLSVSVSHTTRPRRPTEREGINYHFISKNLFRDMARKGGFSNTPSFSGTTTARPSRTCSANAPPDAT